MKSLPTHTGLKTSAPGAVVLVARPEHTHIQTWEVGGRPSSRTWEVCSTNPPGHLNASASGTDGKLEALG